MTDGNGRSGTVAPGETALLSTWLSQTAELDRATTRFVTLAETLPEGVAVMTRERGLFANAPFLALAGVPLRDLPQAPLHRLVPERTARAEVRAALRRAWDGHEERLERVPLVGGDGVARPSRLTLRPLATEMEPTLLVIVENALRGAPSPARGDGGATDGPDTLRAVGLYLTGLANDLRGPLTAFLGHLAALARRTDVPPDLREAFELYRQVTEDTLGRFARALEWGRRAPLSEHVDLRVVVDATIASLEADVMPAEIQVDLALAPVPPIAGIADQLRLAIEHVLRNACEALTERGGRITVTLESRDDRVVLVVADDGPGIPDSLLPHVFDPFSSTKSITTGRGLGLAIVKDIVGRHQGEIAIQSSSAGTAVTFTFGAIHAADGPHPSGKPRVLLVEDNVAIQETYRILLERAQWDVLSARDVDEALRIVAREPVDALVVDVQMAGRDGLALVEALATWHPHLVARV
ncbi:MAG: response regulator, partial [Candidatus Rokubacteria bacterium]|nr:response regulator [Candidatus Rokubacteria bacterium]